ncbi:phosphopantetheine-binding protein [Nonomuraea sp. NPDC055795]
MALEALPRNPNGKLDRKALPTPAMTSSGTRYAAPRTPTEEAIARCWSETLGAEEAGALDDFFKIGGHSLLAIRITVLMRVSFGIEIPIKLVFAERTVERVAAGIEAL